MKSLLFVSAVAAVKIHLRGDNDLTSASLVAVLDTVPVGDYEKAVDAVASPTKDLYDEVVKAAKALADKAGDVDKEAKKTLEAGLKADAVLDLITMLGKSSGELAKKVKAAKESKDEKKAHEEMKSQVQDIVGHVKKIFKSLSKLAEHIDKASSKAKIEDAQKNISELDKEFPNNKMWIFIAIAAVAVIGVGAGAFFLLRKN